MMHTGSTRSLRLLVVALMTTALLGLAGCESDDGPTGPTPPGSFPPIPTGRANVDVSSNESECTRKTPAWGFFGPRASAAATISRDGNAWIVRPAFDRAGQFELRFTASAVSNIDATITGTFRGTVIDLLSSLQFPNPSQAALAGPSGAQDATLNAAYRSPVNGVFGRVTGEIVYTDNQREVMTCTGGMFGLIWFP